MPRHIVCAALVFAFCGRLAAADRVEILSPVDNASVPWRACIIGTLPTAERPAFVVIHPEETSDFYVEPAPTVRDDGGHASFRVQAYFGENTPLHSGKRFELQAVQGPHQPLREGLILAAFPAADFASPIIELVRDDSARSGCDRPRAAPTDSSSAITPTQRPTALPAPAAEIVPPTLAVPDDSSVPGEAGASSGTRGGFALVLGDLFLATLYIALVLLP
jgi:hypothetical protein